MYRHTFQLLTRWDTETDAKSPDISWRWGASHCATERGCWTDSWQLGGWDTTVRQNQDESNVSGSLLHRVASVVCWLTWFLSQQGRWSTGVSSECHQRGFMASFLWAFVEKPILEHRSLSIQGMYLQDFETHNRPRRAPGMAAQSWAALATAVVSITASSGAMPETLGNTQITIKAWWVWNWPQAVAHYNPQVVCFFSQTERALESTRFSGQDAFGATDTCSPAFGITTIPFPVNPNGPPFHHRKLCLCLDIPNVVKNHILIYAIVLYLTYNLYIYNMLYIFTKTYNFLFAFLAYNKPFLAFWILGPHVFLSKSGWPSVPKKWPRLRSKKQVVGTAVMGSVSAMVNRRATPARLMTLEEVWLGGRRAFDGRRLLLHF